MPPDPAPWTHGQGIASGIAKARMQQENPPIRVERSDPKQEEAGKSRIMANAHNRSKHGGRMSQP